MIEQSFDRDSLPTAQEIAEETDSRLERDVITYHRVTDTAYGNTWNLFPVNSPQRRDVAEKIGRYFHRETHFDFAPYTAGDEDDNRVVYLVRTRRMLTAVPLIAGAVELQRVSEDWVLTWIWLHPWERGTALVREVFDLLDETYGSFFIEVPISGAMRSLIKKRNYDENRLVRIQRS